MNQTSSETKTGSISGPTAGSGRGGTEAVCETTAEGIFSAWGRKMTGTSPISELMDDLGRAMSVDPDMLMLGGGNPAPVPAMQSIWRRLMQGLLAREGEFDRMLANYEPPQGNPRFLEAFAQLMSSRFGWPVSPEHVAVTSGTQTAAFFLFNALAGKRTRGGPRRILLPLCPEYIGYADQGLEEGLFVACRPAITWPQGEAERIFKYRIDFDAVEQELRNGGIAVVAVSRPTNPTGNVVTREELERLTELTAQYGVYLMIDGAYGVPFPGVIFGEAEPHFAPHVINTFSLSKLGLPGTRTGIIVGPPEVVAGVKSMTAIVGLANGNLGQQLVLPLLESGELLRLGREVLRPFYQARSEAALSALREQLGTTGADWAVHASEGAFFLWIWLRGLPISSMELYQRLKVRKVLMVPGEFFFYGERSPSEQRRECIRISFAQSPEVVAEGIRRLAEELRAQQS